MEADFINEALSVVSEAERRGIVLRIMGAIAFKIHCPKFRNLHEALGREITDIDFLGYSKQRDQIKKLFVNLGYVERPASLARTLSSLGTREIYYNPANMRKVDVFLDQLRMCHVIDFCGRLEMDCPTIPLAELLLEKMQIVNLTEKDVKDAAVLLREHDAGEGDKEMINAKYIARILSDDWGFYYTVVTNLKKVQSLLNKFDAFTKEDLAKVLEKIDKIISMIENEPKTFKWVMRSKIGTKKKWYKHVDVPT